ncbi:MAG: ATP-dependent RecD-like DNA helicase [Deltaproteobacteria bacterium]|nr:MAG: ATP-dependent RecD-like DNA helicase [Deltaproteobacteria bacterium]
MITLQGRMERITFQNAENQFTIARFRTNKPDNLITVVGCLAGTAVGESLTLSGSWETHPRFGPQFKVSGFKVILPTTPKTIKRYLKSGIIKGIGPRMADRLVSHFKDQTLEIIESYPDRLTEVPGIGQGTADRIVESWHHHHAVRRLMEFLTSHGVDASQGVMLMQQYGLDTEALLRNNPFCLVPDFPRIGFPLADAIAKNLGWSPDAPARVEACLIHILATGADNGHTFLKTPDLKHQARRRFQLTDETVEQAVDEMAQRGDIVIETLPGPDKAEISATYATPLHVAESGIAMRMAAFLSVPLIPYTLSTERILEEVLRQLSIQLSDEQLHTLEAILLHKAAVITGGPGTGKTTLIRSITAIFESLGKDVLLAAPTGRAARRLSEVSGKPAVTIHRLLEYSLTFGGFERNDQNPLETHALIIDEFSMVDTLLMHDILKAMPMTGVLIMVGDAYQLPSVGPGNVLQDFIASGSLPVYALTTIFRQAQESPIVMNAHRVRNGEIPLFRKNLPKNELSEFYFIEQHQPDTVVRTIAELCRNRIPKVFNMDRMTDIQVITPMHRGDVGTINLNQVLQEALNPDGRALNFKGQQFRINDKVMHLKNDYEKEVFNGDIGTVASVDTEFMEVRYDNHRVSYAVAELDTLTLAYAISVHKSQGSEYPAVIVPLLPMHTPLLQRNLLYTAMTRGKSLVILVGSCQALQTALANDRPKHRLSALATRLRKKLGTHQDALADARS